MLKSYKNPQEMFDELDREQKEHPIKNFFFTIQCKLEKWFIDNPRDLINNLKWFIQRGKRGYSDSDTWHFDYHLSNVIAGGLKHLKDNLHSFPCGMVGTQGVSLNKDDPNFLEWKRILGEIIWTFETANKITEREWIYIPISKYRNTKSMLSYAKDVKMHLMTKEECARYKNGWKLFQKYYFDLWD